MEPAVGGGRALARQRPVRRLLPADAPLSPSLARARGGALSPSALRDRRLGSAPISQGGERLRRRSAPRRRGLRGLRIRGLVLGVLESLRRLRLPAGDRGAGTLGPADACVDPRPRGPDRPPGHGGQPRDVRRVDRPRGGPGMASPGTFPGAGRADAALRGAPALRRGDRARPRPRGLGARSDGGARPSFGPALGASGRRAGPRRRGPARRPVARGLLAPVLRGRVPRFALSAAVRPRRGGGGVFGGSPAAPRARPRGGRRRGRRSRGGRAARCVAPRDPAARPRPVRGQGARVDGLRRGDAFRAGARRAALFRARRAGPGGVRPRRRGRASRGGARPAPSSRASGVRPRKRGRRRPGARPGSSSGVGRPLLRNGGRGPRRGA